MGKTLGKTYEQRELAKEVRDLALEEIKGILKYDIEVDKTFRQALLLRIAGNVLPRLTEISGPDGSPIPLLNGLFNNTSSQEDSQAQ